MTIDDKIRVADNLPDDAQRYGRSIATEPRYVSDIVEGFQGEGLTV